MYFSTDGAWHLNTDFKPDKTTCIAWINSAGELPITPIGTGATWKCFHGPGSWWPPSGRQVTVVEVEQMQMQMQMQMQYEHVREPQQQQQRVRAVARRRAVARHR